MQNNQDLSSSSLAAGAVVGGLIGAAVWGGLAFGLGTALAPGQWLGHVFSSPINAASFAAFGAAVGQLLQRRTHILREADGLNVTLVGTDDRLLTRIRSWSLRQIPFRMHISTR